MIQSEIVTAIRRLLAEKSVTSSYLSVDDITAFIEEGIKDMCEKGKVYERTSFIYATDTVASYDLAADFIDMVAIRNPSGLPLDPVTPRQRGALYLIAGKPLYYHTFAKGSATDFRVTLIDTPTTAGGGTGAYPYDYHAMDVALAGSNYSPNFPSLKHRYLVLYGCFRCAEKMKDALAAQTFFTEYCAGLGIQMATQGGGQGA